MSHEPSPPNVKIKCYLTCLLPIVLCLYDYFRISCDKQSESSLTRHTLRKNDQSAFCISVLRLYSYLGTILYVKPIRIIVIALYRHAILAHWVSFAKCPSRVTWLAPLFALKTSTDVVLTSGKQFGDYC